jgi:hypothetical protein
MSGSHQKMATTNENTHKTQLNKEYKLREFTAFFANGIE